MTSTRERWMTLFILCSACLGIAALLLWLRWNKSGNAEVPSTPAPTLVSVVHPKVPHATTVKSYPGVTKAVMHATLFFRVGGPIANILVKPGDAVSKGQLVATLDDRDYQRRIEALESQISGQTAAVELARLEWTRIDKLHQAKIASDEQHDQARIAMRVAAAQLQTLIANIKIAKDQLDDTRLLAPFGGTITKKFIEVHEMANPSAPIFCIQNMEEIDVQAGIPESDIAALLQQKDGVFEINVIAMPNIHFKAHLQEWDVSAEISTRTFGVTFRGRPSSPIFIPSGMTAEVIGPGGEKSGMLVIPSDAIVNQRDGQGTIWIADRANRSAHLTTISVKEYTAGGWAMVDDGISPNDWVITQGRHFIHPDSKLAFSGDQK